MSDNRSDFDPLNMTAAQSDDCVRGYRDGFDGNPPPAFTSEAYDHGRRNGATDRAGVAEPDQIELARRYLGRRPTRGEPVREKRRATLDPSDHRNGRSLWGLDTPHAASRRRAPTCPKAQ